MLLLEHLENLGAECEANKVCEEVGEATYGCHTYYQGDSRCTFPPCSVCELQVMLVMNRTKQQFADNAKNIYSRDHDRATGYDGEHTVEQVCILKRAYNMVISATNPERPGRPRDAKPAII